ncbi:hypothetical protein COHA_009698 [Chlorella ohadii]|uniref:Uncharacterized protein n=1 Tax=Chlorella ohadii TaxID=2649997 RepID=A0AAD5DL87_9CHLO|nr:hypothetical protein COHA_009698 [Chlorella ohadii]
MYEQQEAAVEAAAADLERQRLANEALRERGAALEKIASFKDLSLQALQAAGGQAAAVTGASQLNALPTQPTLKELRSGDSGSAAATGAAAPAVSSAASSGVQQQQAGAGGLPTADAQPVAASSASTGAGSSEGGGGTSSGGGLRRRPFEQRAEELTALANREQGGGLAAPSTTPMQQLRDEVLSMAADDFLQDWADFGALAAQTLAELDAGRINEQQAAARLAPAVQYRSLLHTAMLHYKPEVYKQLLAHTHFPEEGAEAAAQRWRTVALAMGCTRAQALQLREQYQAYCSRLRQLSADSAACMRQLTSLAQEQLGPGPGPGQAASVEGEGEEGSFLAGRSLRSMMASYLQLFEAAQRLARQPDAALVALLEFHTATGSVISGMQKARCAALYKPLFPDIVAIVRACLEQHGLLPPDAGTGRAVAAAAAAPHTAV